MFIYFIQHQQQPCLTPSILLLQEEPLPHELRPVPVLKMTMDYLATNVMDLVELGREGEWFDFLWNRTRGIRKVYQLIYPHC